MGTIDTDAYSTQLRSKAVRPDEGRLLIARLGGSHQEKDLSAPVNCGGYGRIRQFRFDRHDDWSTNPLPIVPAAQALGHDPGLALRAQVFQNAACNWRCWYCYVDFRLLAADQGVSDYFTPLELVDRYLAEVDRPAVIDLSGGQPDLVPEWVPWTIEALEARGLAERVFLWSDDNLSNFYFWRYLSLSQRQLVATYPMYARVACFKGFDERSFAFNTRAAPTLFTRQFDVFARLLAEGINLYAYVTFTVPPQPGLAREMTAFVDRLQRIHPNLPLRTVPLKVEVFTPTSNRVHAAQSEALAFQHDVHAAWLEELDKRFSTDQRRTPICDIPMTVTEQ